MGDIKITKTTREDGYVLSVEGTLYPNHGAKYAAATAEAAGRYSNGVVTYLHTIDGPPRVKARADRTATTDPAELTAAVRKMLVGIDAECYRLDQLRRDLTIINKVAPL